MNVPNLSRPTESTQNSKNTLCLHRRVREIGQDFDKEGLLISLERCQGCGLLFRRYLLSK